MPDDTPQAPQGVTLDMSKSTPLPAAAPAGVTLDMSKSQSLPNAAQSPEEVAARHARSVADARGRGLRTDLPDQEDFMDKVRTGAGKEGVATASGLANLANKVLPSVIQIPTEQHTIETTLPEGPEKQRALAEAKDDITTHGVGETLGGLAENIGEFAAGDEILKGLSKLAKVPEAVLALAEKYPKMAKIFTASAKGATVGGAQGAVKESASGGAGAKAGLEEGGAGGAAGGAASEILPIVAKPILKSVGLGTESVEDALRAAQPGKRNMKFIEDWATAQPRLVQELEEGGKFKDMGEAADRIGDVRRKIWTDEVMPAIERHADETFDTTKVAQAVREKITGTLQKRFPEDAKFLQEFADKYTSGSPLFSGENTVADAEKEIELYNSKLDSEGYWKKTPKERAAMEKANPKIAAWRTASDQIRSSLYEHLESAGETNIKALKNEYGAIGNVENEVRGQVNVAGRQRPISLKQVIGMTAGLAHGGPLGALAAALPIVDKLYNAPEELLNRAISKSAPAGPVKQAVQTAASATGAAAKKAAPVVGANMVRFLASDGSVHEVNKDQLDDAKKIDPGLKVQ